ncbi:MAG: M12 family metallo-peptidase [Phycisphaerales bacterium]|nr:M12 family metallo-peptidase [Phycisphaerales bacterium]MCI0674372.1 M12 family metallo-peptidase [Phycisphaerales bacterium]
MFGHRSISVAAALVAMGVVGFGGESVGRQPPEASDDLVGVATMMEAILQVRAASVVELVVEDAGAPPEKTVNVRLGLEQRTIRVKPFSMRSPHCRVLVQDETGALKEEELPEVASYRGGLDEDPAAAVSATIIDGQVWAMIRSGDGEVWQVEPSSKALPGLPVGWHTVYRAADAKGNGGICGVGDLGVNQLPNVGNPAQPAGDDGGIAGSNGRTEIAFDADVEFYQLNGSSVSATILDIEMIMNNVGMIYQNQVGICYSMTGFIVRTADPDPYVSTNSDVMLCEFRSEWNGGGYFDRDVAHLMTGKNLDGSIIGLAWVGVICDVPNFACGGIGSAAYGLSQSTQPSLANRTQLTAHELGHNWNACHCNQTMCIDPPDPDCGIMASGISGVLVFEPFSQSTIMSFRDSRGCLDPCLDPIYVDWSNGGPQDGSAANPFDTVTEGVAAAMIGGTVSIAAGTYLENITTNEAVTLTSTGGSAVIGD